MRGNNIQMGELALFPGLDNTQLRASRVLLTFVISRSLLRRVKCEGDMLILLHQEALLEI